MPGLKIGITASRLGLRPEQKAALIRIVKSLEPAQLHHGDCLGGDADAHEIGRRFGLYIVGHLPSNPSQRALCDFDEIRTPKPYLERNHNIVDEADQLFAFPKTWDEELRSGTWATIRYARQQKKPGLIIYPDGMKERICPE